MEVWEHYTRELHRELRYFATWLPHERLELGMIGTLEEGRFDFVTTLSQQEIPFTEQVSAKAAFDHRSGAEQSAGVEVGAKLTNVGGAETTIQFTRRGAFVFQAKSCTVHSFADRKKLEEDILAASAQRPEDAWDPRWVIVDSVVRSKQAVVLVSTSAEASVVISGDAEIKEADIVDAIARGRITISRGSVTQIVASRNETLTPLFRLLRLRPRHMGLFGPLEVQAVRSTGEVEPLPEPGSPQEPFLEVEFAPGLSCVNGIPRQAP